jgi:hypothetical protein
MESIEKYKELLNSIDQIDATNEYAYEKVLLNFINLDKLPVVLYEIPSGTHLYRARPHFENILFEEIHKIGIPPQQAVKNYARCNKPFQSVFYCSENRPTSHMELLEYIAEETKIGEKIYVTIGQWLVKVPLNVIIVADPDNNITNKFDSYHCKGINQFLDMYSGEERQKYYIFFKFLTEKFRKHAKKDMKTYLISTAYCNLALMHSNGKANGIFYPSVPFNGEGSNFCLNSEFVLNNDNIELTSAIRDEFICYENEIKKPSFFETELIKCKSIDINQNKIFW